MSISYAHKLSIHDNNGIMYVLMYVVHFRMMFVHKFTLTLLSCTISFCFILTYCLAQFSLRWCESLYLIKRAQVSIYPSLISLTIRTELRTPSLITLESSLSLISLEYSLEITDVLTSNISYNNEINIQKTVME